MNPLPNLQSKNLPPLYLITEGASLSTQDLISILEKSVEGGLQMIQIRRKHLTSEELEGELEQLLFQRSGLLWILNRHVELVKKYKLDGVHLGESPQQVLEARKYLGEEFIIGYSAHEENEADLALQSGADYVSLSPIFSPISKFSPSQPWGIERLQAACKQVQGCIYALGGVNSTRVPELRGTGVHGLAVLGAIQSSENPKRITRELLELWESSG